jgi:hypothetical protein
MKDQVEMRPPMFPNLKGKESQRNVGILADDSRELLSQGIARIICGVLHLHDVETDC